MKSDTFDVVEDVKKVGLDGVGVGGLAQNFQQGRVRDKEETRKQQTLLLQIADSIKAKMLIAIFKATKQTNQQ